MIFRGSPFGVIGEQGLHSLIAASRERRDHDLAELFEKAAYDLQQNSSEKLELHAKCRRCYVEPNRIAQLKQVPS